MKKDWVEFEKIIESDERGWRKEFDEEMEENGI